MDGFAGVTLIGLPTDVNSSFLRGAAAGPAAIRKAMWSEASNTFADCGIELVRGGNVLDLGDLPLTGAAEDDEVIGAAVASVLAEGRVPLALGGDHSVTFPLLAALARAHGAVDVLHIDAHPDLYDDFEGNPRSHASPFARIMEAGLASRLVQVGIRTMNAHQSRQVARFRVEVVPMRRFTMDALPRLSGPTYISIDLDGLDPAFAPGVTHCEPGGLSTREVLDIIDALPGPIVGADVVELNPARDINEMTATVAAKLVKTIAGRILLDSRGGTSAGQ